MVKPQHFVRKISNDQTCVARAVIVRGIDSHSRACNTGFAKGNTRSSGGFAKRAVAVVAIEFVWLGVVAHKQVRPAIAVVIDDRDAESLTGRVVYTGFRTDILKFATAKIVIKMTGRAFV